MNPVAVDNSLGGLMNQDVAKTVLKPDFVYDSQNFRVTDDGGGTFAARVNIRGNKEILDIPSTSNVVKVDLPTNMVVGYAYTFEVTLNGVLLSTITLTYTDPEVFIHDFVTAIKADVLLPANLSFAERLDGINSYFLIFGTDGTGVISCTVNNTNTSVPLPVVNGTFTTDLSGWTEVTGPAWAWDSSFGGSAALNAAAGTVRSLFQPLPTLISGTYTVNFSTVCASAGVVGTVDVYLGTVLIGSTTLLNGTNTFSFTNTIIPTGTDLKIEVTLSAGTILWYLTDISVTTGSNVITNVNDAFIVAQDNLKIIGWTTLRDDLYLFTTNESGDPDLTTINSYGQIWKLVYDKGSDNSNPTNYTLSLIYNGLLNFTIKRPIANPGMIQVRYENPTTQKIYWTDNYNKPRVINVADPNAFQLSPIALQLFPSITYDTPIINKIITGGSLKTGMFEYTYRLKRSNGAETQFSLPSRPVFITPYPEDTTAFKDYRGSDANVVAGKSVEITIDNIDTSFDKIELVFVYFGIKGSLPQTYIFAEEFINDQDSMTFIHSGEEVVVPISIDELTAFNANITKVKSLVSKKDTLFLANVTVSQFDIDYDSRAYRFPFGSTTTVVKDTQGNQYKLDATQDFKVIEEDKGFGFTPPVSGIYDLPEIHDAIQDYDSQAPFSTSNNLYVSNGADVIESLGGQGPKISYRFVTDDITCDDKNIGNVFTAGDSGAAKVPYREVTTKITGTTDLGDHTHPIQNSYKSYVSPYISPLLAGYQRDEMYRAGIVFIDKQGNRSYVKWIADIRMPHIYMPNGTNKEDRQLAFPLVTTDTSLKGYTHPVYIEFDVDVTGLSDEIAGYSIVIADRTENDKHILGQGIFSLALKNDSTPSPYTAHLCNADAVDVTNGYYPANGASNVDQYWLNLASLKSPDFMFRGFPGWRAGDEMDLVGLMDCTQSRFTYGTFGERVMDGEGGGSNRAGIVVKHYNHVDSIGVTPHAIYDPTADGPIYPIHEAVPTPRYDNDNAWFSMNLINQWSIGVNASPFFISNTTPWKIDTNYGAGRFHANRFGGSTVTLNFGGDAPTPSALGGSFDWQPSIYGGGARAFQELDKWTSFTDNTGSRGQRAYIANYKRTLNAQYGGNSYSQRSNTIYRYAYNFMQVASGDTIKTLRLASGDTYTLVHDMVYEFIDGYRVFNSSRLHEAINETKRFSERGGMRIFQTALESTINTELRGQETAQVPNEFEVPGECTYENGNEVTIDFDEIYQTYDTDLFSWKPGYMNFFPKPFDFKQEELFDTRVYKSEPKSNGETVDSWSTFRVDSYLDVESHYGPINNLIVFKDMLLYFQDKAFGKFQVSEQQLLPDGTGTSELVLGSSGILERYDYISTISGSKHQFSFALNDSSLIWVDALQRKAMSFGGRNGLSAPSDIKGLTVFMHKKLSTGLQTNDNPYDDFGITSTFDYRHNEFLVSLLNKDTQEYYTVAYNDILDGYTGFYTYTPKVFINDTLNIFTIGNNQNFTNSLFINDFGDFGVFYNNIARESKITFLVNHAPDKEKILTNFEFLTEAYALTTQYDEYDAFAIPITFDFFDKLRVFNSYQNTDFINTSEIAKRRKTIWNVKVPGNRVIGNTGNTDIFLGSNISPTRTANIQRMKDRYFVVDAVYNNADNYKFVANRVKSLIMLNPR